MPFAFSDTRVSRAPVTDSGAERDGRLLPGAHAPPGRHASGPPASETKNEPRYLLTPEPGRHGKRRTGQDGLRVVTLVAGVVVRGSDGAIEWRAWSVEGDGPVDGAPLPRPIDMRAMPRRYDHSSVGSWQWPADTVRVGDGVAQANNASVLRHVVQITVRVRLLEIQSWGETLMEEREREAGSLQDAPSRQRLPDRASMERIDSCKTCWPKTSL
jgi:hypothetical protein